MRSRCVKSLADHEKSFKTKRCVVTFTGESCVQEKEFWVDLSQEGEAVNGFFGTQALGVQRHTVRAHLEASADPMWLVCSRNTV